MEDRYLEKELDEITPRRELSMIIPEELSERILRVADYLDSGSFIRIINKLTDYAEIITEGKLAGTVNFNFSFTSTQTNAVIDLLVEMNALSRIFSLALKGSRDIEAEYISNIFSDPSHPENISSYISIRNNLENRLNHQIQHYNMNMGKSNSTQAMPLNELKSHIKTYLDLSRGNVSVSTKAQHGYIAASLHDAYVTIMNRPEWWNDRTYMKFFFNEEAFRGESPLIMNRKTRLTLKDIYNRIEAVATRLEEVRAKRKGEEYPATREQADIRFKLIKNANQQNSEQGQNRMFNDRMMATPFGKQYGTRIDSIIDGFFQPENEEMVREMLDLDIHDHILALYNAYLSDPGLIWNSRFIENIRITASFLLYQDYGIKAFAEKYLYINRKEMFSRFFSGSNKTQIEEFVTDIFTIFFEDRFSSLFRIIRGAEMKKFACAFIIKRIYLKIGDSMTPFGFFLLKAIGKSGNIRVE